MQPLAVRDGRFFLRGAPLQIVSGELHYPRIPRSHWQSRLRMARAMGLNTVCTYVFWNLHEPEPGHYDFTGSNDVAAFIRAAQNEGLHVILRPGPYVCAEWDFGGYPAWLLRDPATVVRSLDERFMAPARRWLTRLGREMAPLYAMHGGPIIAVQVENEYGSFGNDHRFMAATRDAMRAAGFGDAFLFTADGPTQLPDGTLPDVTPFLNATDPKTELAALHAFRPSAPMMCSEFYPGWFDHWGEVHHLVAPDGSARDLEWLLARGDSVNVYLFHGGTTFGYMNGANDSPSEPYQPTTTSYDYDAPLDEGGAPTEKYRIFRDLIAKYAAAPLPAIPETPPRIAVAEFALDERAALAPLLTAPAHDEAPRHMEAYGQSFGYIAYRTTLQGPVKGTLRFGDVRDYAVVLLGDERVGDLDRRHGEREIALDVPAGAQTLTVLVENSGRINYGKLLAGERKGVVAPVTLDGRALTGWDVFTLPLHDRSALQFAHDAVPTDMPAFFRGTFEVDALGDTFLDTRMFGKGALWINGHHAGRFWSIGPQYSLYVPAEWLQRGSNEVVVFDLAHRTVRRSRGVTQPLFAPIVE
ncbi:MAG: beta-galactosidase [Candidatus Eremiobacteraeota bacterium]|nr:beta-galactosidase [Candidatus Eremiobacteraeota bacterium]